MQLGGNDGSCVLKSSLAMCLVYDPGTAPFADEQFNCILLVSFVSSNNMFLIRKIRSIILRAPNDYHICGN